MNQVLLFSLIAMASPTMAAATTVMLLTPNPKQVLVACLVGAMLTSVAIGLVVVFALQGSRAVSTTRHELSPALDLILGVVFLGLAGALGTGGSQRLAERRTRRTDVRPQRRWQRALNEGSPRVTFAVGALLALPGVSYLAALGGIAKMNTATAPAVLLVLLVNIIMLLILELPLLGLALAPDWTPAVLQRARGWFGANSHEIAVVGTSLLGTLLVTRGVIGALG